jgi:hypothetical protein
MARDYKDEYEKFQSSPEQKALRVVRNRNRRRLLKGGKVKKGDGMDIHHKGGELTIEPKSKNRGRREKSRLKKSKRRRWRLRKKNK